MVESARLLRVRLADELVRGNCKLRAARAALDFELGRDFGDEEAADVLAQAAVCAAAIVGAEATRFGRAAAWLSPQLSGWERVALEEATDVLGTEYPVLSTSAGEDGPERCWASHLYEPFLRHYARDDRKRRGVYFTPQPVAEFIVAEVDRLLRDRFGLADGIATHSALRTGRSALPFFLDPATGTGVFLLRVIDHVHQALRASGQRAGCAESEQQNRWHTFVPCLLSRLAGIEILPAAALLAKLNIALKLAETGYTFDRPGRINIIVGDALSAATHSALRIPHSAFPVLLGNPPFSSLTTNTNDWIARLVRGDDEIRGYVRANGQQLRERKTWLFDDYVKFIRLAQWYVEEAGCGIVGFVTNHGYLDNATFRLMRQELLRAFPRVRIIDLHGNRKKHEVAPDGGRDENVFGLDQGVAIGLFCRPPTQGRSVSEGSCRQTEIEHVDLWGSREAKLAAIGNPSLGLHACVLAPQPPQWRLLPTLARMCHREYDAAWPLVEAMPVNATAPVTARDHFVVAFSLEELRQRIEEFRDLSIPDDEIRRRYFTRTRSARYEQGDTRGWKLAAARRVLAADDDWERHIVRCLYRPFDWRFVFWHPAMIDWPRTQVTRHLIEGSGSRIHSSGECGMRNAECGVEAPRVMPESVLCTEYSVQSTAALADPIFDAEISSIPHAAFRTPHSALAPRPQPLAPLCLIARRQQLPSQPCTFFWIAGGLALDGVIRSDNRGSESLFPLYLRDENGDGRAAWRANFAADFVEQVRRQVQLVWLPLGSGDLSGTFGPEDLLAYIYALFHAQSFRERYADELRGDFPRVPVPREGELLVRLCRLGHELIALHLLQGGEGETCVVRGSPDPARSRTECLSVARSGDRATTAPRDFVAGPAQQELRPPGLAPEVENFRVGGYEVLRKWLQPRHRSPADPQYGQIAAAIGRTIETMHSIDAAIAAAGGCKRALAPRPPTL